MKPSLQSIILVAAMTGSSALAQMMPFGGGSSKAMMNPAIAKIFGSATAASATAHFTIKDSRGQTTEMEARMSMRDGKTRSDMDLTKLKTANMNPNAAMQMKRMGMDRMVTVSQPDKNLSLMIYPSMHAYAEMSTASYGGAGGGDASTAQGAQGGKVEKISLGKETIDGHECEKNKITFTSEQGQSHEATVWNATDLKDFPIQMQIAERDSTITIKYTDVKLEKPDASLFEAPADFTKYDSMQAMMQTEMMKRMGNGGGFGR